MSEQVKTLYCDTCKHLEPHLCSGSSKKCTCLSCDTMIIKENKNE